MTIDPFSPVGFIAPPRFLATVLVNFFGSLGVWYLQFEVFR